MTRFASTIHILARTATRFRATLLLFVLLAGGVMGCQAQRFATPIKVGFLAPLEGERRELGYSLLPTLLAAAPSEIQGRPIEWVILDTHSDPATAAQRARELVADPAVLYIIGPVLPEEAEAVQPVIQEADMAWTPLTPIGAEGMQAWSGGIPWWGECWVSQHLKSENSFDISVCATVQTPTDTSAYVTAVGSDPTPETWLVWDAARYAFTQLESASSLNRDTIHSEAQPYILPPAVEFTY